jgi:predicted PurR-regulated permease PerM
MTDETPEGGAPPQPEGERRRRRRRAGTVMGAFGPGGWVRQSARLWGFLGFAILVLILTRHVILPFIFALLLVYILAPLIQSMSFRSDGTQRMPKGLSIIICYIVLITLISLFVVVLVPRISKDVARLGAEAPKLYDKLNDEWAPKAARWLEKRFPSMAPPAEDEERTAVVGDVPMPPGTSFVITPLPDGRYAIQLSESGLKVSESSKGGYVIVPNEAKPAPMRTEDKIRAWASRSLAKMQSQIGDVFKFGQALVGTVVRSVFTFFLVLMVAAFILIDIEKIHSFVRDLVPRQYRSDYDVIIAGVNRGLSGVIRGQLLICLVNGILTYIGLVIFGVKYSLILAVVAAVLSLIPIFGSILSTIPIVLAALVSTDQGVAIDKAVAMTAWIVGIHFLEGNFLNPKIIGSAAKIHPVLVIFALIVGEHSYGLIGALLAVPVASIIQVLFLFFRNKAWRGDGPQGPADKALDTIAL